VAGGHDPAVDERRRDHDNPGGPNPSGSRGRSISAPTPGWAHDSRRPFHSSGISRNRNPRFGCS
jgi:hypothetical protein